MPFHVEGEAHRISVDIDLYTPASRDHVAEAVPGALARRGFAPTELLRAGRAMALLHLVRFTSGLQSHFGVRASTHIDIACGIDMGMIDTVTFPAGVPVLGFRTERAVSALSRGSLIADKMPSLGIGTVGYGKLKSTPKQIYDVGTLIQHSGAGDLESALLTYERLSDFKLAHDSRGHGRDEVTRSIVGYLEGIGRPGNSPEASRHWADFEEFSQGMLSARMSDPQDHAERILLCLLLARSLRPGGGVSRAEEAAGLYATLDESRAKKGDGGAPGVPAQTAGPGGIAGRARAARPCHGLPGGRDLGRGGTCVAHGRRHHLHGPAATPRTRPGNDMPCYRAPGMHSITLWHSPAMRPARLLSARRAPPLLPPRRRP